MTTPRKHIDNRWLTFALQGVIALLFGWFVAFTRLQDSKMLVIYTSIVLLVLGLIELFTLVSRHRPQKTWGLTLTVAMLSVVAAIIMLFTRDMNVVLHLGIIASYTALRGVTEILIGLKTDDDLTDKTLRVICGMCGAILGLVILNSGSQADVTSFFSAFGIYMIILGMSNLFYGVHNHDQKQLYAAERKAAAAKRTQPAKKVAKKAPAKKSAKSTAKRTTKSRKK